MITLPIHTLLCIASLFAPAGLFSTVQFLHIPVRTAVERELDRLGEMPASPVSLRQVTLYEAISLLAESAGMAFLAPAPSEFPEVISLKSDSTPFALISFLGNRYNFAAHFEEGIWRFERPDPEALTTRHYALRFDDRTQITLPPLSGLRRRNEGSQERASPARSGETLLIVELERLIPELMGKLVYLPESRQLIATATEDQHDRIADYLKAADQPRRLISIDTFFVETSQEPSLRLGLEWKRLVGEEYTLSGLGPYSLQGGNRTQLLQQAILSFPDFSSRFQFLAEDRRSTLAQFPRVVTSNNRPVSLDSLLLIPFESGRTSISLTGAATESQVEFLEVGTTVRIHPRIIDGVAGHLHESVHLVVSVVISSEAGTVEIDQRSYPVLSSRSYDFEVAVPSGYVLAVGGLKEPTQTLEIAKLPLLGDIPFLGSLFRSSRTQRRDRDLIAFIAPRILDHTPESFSPAPPDTPPSLEAVFDRVSPHP